MAWMHLAVVLGTWRLERYRGEGQKGSGAVDSSSLNPPVASMFIGGDPDTPSLIDKCTVIQEFCGPNHNKPKVKPR